MFDSRVSGTISLLGTTSTIGRKPDVGGSCGGPVRVRGLVRAEARPPAGAGTAGPAQADQSRRDGADRYRYRTAAGRVHPAPLPEREAGRTDYDRVTSGQGGRLAAGVQLAVAELARGDGGAGVTRPGARAGSPRAQANGSRS